MTVFLSDIFHIAECRRMVNTLDESFGVYDNQHLQTGTKRKSRNSPGLVQTVSASLQQCDKPSAQGVLPSSIY